MLALCQFEQARAECERVLAQRPAPWARLALARAHEGLGESEQARAVLTELLADAPEYLAAYDALSQLHGRAQNDDDAKAVLCMALEVSPHVVHRHKSIGEIALRTNDLDTAEVAFGALVQQLVSNNHDDDKLIANVRQMSTELDRAEQGDTLIERSVGNAVRVNNEGVARAKSGDLEGAIELLEAAAASMPENTHIVMNAAHALLAHMQVHGMQSDKQAKVADYLRRVRARDPSHPKYLEVLALERQLSVQQTEQAA